MEIDSLVISLGLDPSKLQAALEQVQAAIQQGQVDIADFVQGIQEGFQEALQEVAEGSAQAGGAVAQAGEAAEEAGQKFREAGSRGAQGMQELGDKAQQAAAKAKAAGGEVQALGRRVGGFIRGIITTVATPLAGALSAGAIIGSYMGDVAQVAQMTGRYSTQMEEWRKKRELLSRINREDVELYRKGKLALLDFNFAMSGLSTTIMRALSPAIRFGIDLLTSLADWIRRNEPNIIRFFTVLAAVVTAKLIPAVSALTKVMLKNPLVRIIAGILLLAAVIDDFVTYVQGGESALEGLWSQFGTGEEIARALGEAWEWLKSVGEALFDGLLSAGRAFIANFGDAFEGLKEIVQGTVNFIKAVFGGKWEDAGKAVRQVFEGVFKYLFGVFTGVIETIKQAIQEVLSMIPSWDSIKSGASAVWDAGKEFVGGIFGRGDDGGNAAPPLPPTNSELTQAAVPVSATTNNTKNVKVEAQNNITVNAPGADPQAMAGAFGNQMRQQNAQLGALVAEGGVRQ